MFGMLPYLLTCTQPGHITLASKSLATSWRTGLLRGCNLTMSDCTSWASIEFNLLEIVLFGPRLLSIKRAFFKFLIFSLSFLWSRKLPENSLRGCSCTLVIRNTNPTARPAFRDVDELWKVRVPGYTDDLLLRGHRY